jgi:hypothetical protein
MAALAIVSAAACGGDSFGPDDAGTSESTPDTQAASESDVEELVDVCTRLCEGQIAGGCHVALQNPDDCSWICSVFRESAITAECRDRAMVAFECQVATPCTTAGCNDLLKEAEDTCPKLPSF